MTAWLLGNSLAVRAVSFILGVLLLALMTRGLKTGSTELVYRPISRQQDPAMYWTGIALAAVGGVLLVLAAIFPQLHRL